MKITQQLLLVLIALVALTTFSCSSDNEAPTDTNNNTVISQDAITLACDINDDTTLTNHAEGVDYIVECNVDVKALLTIEPGTTIVFKSDKSIYVDTGGALSAIGTSSNQITFKGEQAIPGYWKGIGFESNDVRNELNFTVISDAGSSPIASTWYNKKAAVVILKTVNTGKLSLKNSTIQNTNGIGLVAMNHITNYSIADLHAFSNNNFNNNSSYAVRVSSKHVGKIDSNSTYINNGFDGVSIRESRLNEGTNHTWQGINYSIDGEIDVRDGLTILAGANLQFTPNGFIRVKGNNAYINATGAQNNKITFTGEVTTPGSWKGLYFFQSNNIQNNFNHCEILYGGSAAHTFVNNKANLTLFDGSKVNVTNSELSNSDGCGIIIGSNTGSGWAQCFITQSNNTFNNNSGNDTCNQG